MSTPEPAEGLQLGFIGLGRMGLNMVRRLHERGIRCVAHDPRPEAREAAAAYGATPAASLADLAIALAPPRVVWLMVPAGAVDAVLGELVPHLGAGDTLVEGGNTHYVDDLRRAEALATRAIRYLDVGVSGGVWGYARGYCLMIGGPQEVYSALEPVFAALAPGPDAAPRTPGREEAPGPAERGYLHCGPTGAGHFVKMVHNGIEYGLMQAYAEGFNLLHHADAGVDAGGAKTAPLAPPQGHRYRLPVAEIAELWRRGSVIGSWLLDLTAAELHRDPALRAYAGRVADSGEGRWTLLAAIETGVPVPVLSAALYARFTSQGTAAYADQVLSAMRHGFGGHRVRRDGAT
jgi:6-phosphogluconate dehydrogenase